MLYEVITKKVISNEIGIARAKQISEKKTNMFRAVISFTTAQAQGLGLNSLNDWQEYVITSYSIHYTKLYDLQSVALVIFGAVEVCLLANRFNFLLSRIKRI